jgi:hypothetical protein
MLEKTQIKRNQSFIRPQQDFPFIKIDHKANNNLEQNSIIKLLKKRNISYHNDHRLQKAPDLRT